MNKAEKLENLRKEMQEKKVDIVGINEAKWREEQDFWFDDYRIIITKSNKGRGTIMNRRIGQQVINYGQHSDRLIFITIESKPNPLRIVKVYMLTSEIVQDEVKKLYEEIEELIKHVRGDENLIIFIIMVVVGML